jgi:hypothetical protein
MFYSIKRLAVFRNLNLLKMNLYKHTLQTNCILTNISPLKLITIYPQVCGYTNVTGMLKHTTVFDNLIK